MKRLLTSLLATALMVFALSGCTTVEEQGEDTSATTTMQDEAVSGSEAAREDPDAAALAEGMTVKYIDKYFTNFQEAIQDANQNGGGTVVLLADSVVSETDAVPTIAFRTNIIIKSKDGNAYKLIAPEGWSGEMLRITDGTIVMQDIVFDGQGKDLGAPLIVVSNLARVTFVKNVTLTNGVNTSGGATALSVSGADAHLILQGLTIANCSGANAALVNDGATITDEGAIFKNNTNSVGGSADYS